MTFLDMIEMYNVINGNDLDNITAMFNDIVLDQRLDKETLVGVLLDQCGAMDCIYETTATFKYFSNNFFKKYQWNITKLCDTLSFQYDPLKTKNIQWTETTQIEQNLDTEEDRTRANTGTQGNAYEESESKSKTEKNTHADTDNNSYSDTQTNTISAMNSSSYEPDNKRDTSGSGSTTNSGNYTNTDTETNSKTSTNTRTDNLNERINATKGEDLNWDETDTHIESGIEGTAYQDLIQKERKQAEYNIYNWIANKYAHELFLLVY